MTCTHNWQIDTPERGATVEGVCFKCGAKREFRSRWNPEDYGLSWNYQGKRGFAGEYCPEVFDTPGTARHHGEALKFRR